MKAIKVAIGCASLSLMFSAQSAYSQDSVEKSAAGSLLAQGEDLAKGGKWEKAQEVFLKACSQNPSDVVALHDLAVSYAHTENLNQAADCERKALAIDEQYVPAHIELAWILNMQEDKDGAREHLKKALEIDPNNITAIKNLRAIMSRFKKKTAPKAVQTELVAEPAAQPRQLTPETPVSRALEVRGATMFRQGKYDIAKRFYEQALQNCPDSVVARAALGVVKGTTGDIEGQIKDEQQALSIQPKDAGALASLGWGLAQQGDAKESLLSYQKSLEVNPSGVEAQSGQGIMLYRTGKPEAAIAVLKEAVRVSPDQAPLRLSLAAVLQTLDRNEEAVAQYQEALRLAPNNPEIKSRMAASCLSADKFDKAAELYKQLIERTPTNAEYRIGLGLALTKTNDISGAYQQFKKAADLDKNLAAAHACLSMIEEVKGRISQAENYARTAQEKDPENKFLKDSLDRLAKSKKETEM
jgi:Flp pilus assembly protein TadD